MQQKEIWQPVNLAEMFYTNSIKFSNREALSYKVGHHYKSLTYFDLKTEVLKAVMAFKELGLKKDDKVIIISENRPEWVITDLALISLGVVNVPIHSILSAEQLKEVIQQIRPKIIFFSGKEIEDKLLEISEEISKVENLVSYENLASSTLGKNINFKNFIDKFKVSENEESEIISYALSMKPQTLASIIFTSGTSGHLKGVKLTHENFIQNILGVLDIVMIYPEDKFFSILPLSHVFERAAGYYIALMTGASIGFCIDINNLSVEIKDRKPTIVLAVPRLFEKIYEKIHEKVEKKFLSKVIFKLALRHNRKNKKDFLANIFDKLVFSKIRSEFGGNIRFFVSGGATLPEKIGYFFNKAGMLIIEGYGLTETASVVSGNGPSFNKFGTVGKPAYNLDVKLAADGEILVKGSSVMIGYLKDEDNKSAFTKDGYFKTGDLGEFDEYGYLKIKGRKKDLIVLTTGKKVAPVPIEESLEFSPYINQAMVFGEAKKHIAAILVINFDKLSEKFEIKGKKNLLKDERVLDFIYNEVLETTKNYSSIEKIRKYIFAKEPFSLENGQLTPSFKLRRHIIMDVYKEQIDKLYS